MVGLGMVTLLLAVIAASQVMLIVQATSRDEAVPTAPVRYADITNPAPLSEQAQNVFDEIVAASSTTGETVAFLPGPDPVRCPNPVLRSASETEAPASQGAYLGAGLTLVRIAFPAEGTTQVRFYECVKPPGTSG